MTGQRLRSPRAPTRAGQSGPTQCVLLAEYEAGTDCAEADSDGDGWCAADASGDSFDCDAAVPHTDPGAPWFVDGVHDDCCRAGDTEDDCPAAATGACWSNGGGGSGRALFVLLAPLGLVGRRRRARGSAGSGSCGCRPQEPAGTRTLGGLPR